MKIHEFRAAVTIDQPVDEVFAFFASAHNLDSITPEWLKFEIETPPDVKMGEGTILDYRLRLRGVPMRWRSEITVWDPPRRFVDEQRRGPYRLWIHEHRFEPAGTATIIHDHVRYAVPGWLLEPVVHRLFIRRDIQRIFEHRERRIREILGGNRDASNT